MPTCRYVVALAWSPDGAHIAIVTGDNSHTVHIYQLNLHLSTPSHCIFSSSGHKGEPPQVFGVVWNPYKRCINQKTRQTVPGAMEFVTYGVKHIKFWRYSRDLDTYQGGGSPTRLVGSRSLVGSCPVGDVL
jgi:lipoxygenase homology domain-containing protein 1